MMREESTNRDLQRWIFIIGLILIVVLAAIPRLMTYDFSLPYVDHADEPNFYLAGLEIRGKYDNFGYYQGYPPGYLYFNALVQSIVEPMGVMGTGETVAVLRLVAVAINLATAVFIALAARRAAGNAAGLFAGGIWASSWVVLREGLYAIPGPFVYFWTGLALWLAIEAVVDEERASLAVWSVAAGLLAVVFKYQFVPAVLPGSIVALVYFFRDRRKNWPLIAIPAALSIVVIIVLILQFEPGTGVLRPDREGDEFITNGLRNLLLIERLLNNIFHVFKAIDAVLTLSIIGIGAGAYIAARKLNRPAVPWQPAALSLLVIIIVPWLIGTYSTVQINHRIRDVLPATVAACVLVGIAVGQIVKLIPDRWQAARSVLPAVLFIPFLIVNARQTADLVAERSLPDRRVALREWYARNLEPDIVLITKVNAKTFNPYWGGISGYEWVDWHATNDPLERSVEGWRQELGISYAVLPLHMRDTMAESAEGQAFLDKLLPLRTFDAPPQARGPEMTIYRLWRMEHELDVRFGEHIHLIGYDEQTEGYAPGNTVTYHFYWQADQQPAENYSLFVHLTPAGEVQPVTQADGNPARSERLTLTWTNPDEVLISAPFQLTLPPDLPPGEYVVRIGLYNYQTGVRLPVITSDGDASSPDSYQLARFTISAD